MNIKILRYNVEVDRRGFGTLDLEVKELPKYYETYMSKYLTDYSCGRVKMEKITYDLY